MLIEDLSTQIYYNLTVPLVCRMILHDCARWNSLLQNDLTNIVEMYSYVSKNEYI